MIDNKNRTKSFVLLGNEAAALQRVVGYIKPGAEGVSLERALGYGAEKKEALLADQSGTRCCPVIEERDGKRVTEWGVPGDVDPGDFFFSVIETALSLEASEIELTPAEEFGEVRVHFRVGSEFLAQAPLTPMQFGLLAILLADTSIKGRDNSTRPVRIFRAPDGTSYHLRFAKIREPDRSSAILISLIEQPADQPELASAVGG